MLSVFKLLLVSCKPGASRELALRPQGLRSSTVSKLVFSYVIVVNRKNVILLVFELFRSLKGFGQLHLGKSSKSA